MKHGTYQGGIRTVEDFRLRSWVDPDTGCWIWRMYHYRGVPFASIVEDGGFRRCPARRAVLFASGKQPKTGQVAISKVGICSNRSCVNPDHLFFGPVKKASRSAVEAGKFNRPEILTRLAVYRDKRRKLTVAQFAAITKEQGSCKEIASRYGVSPQRVSAIRKTHGDKAPFEPKPIINSIFNLGG